MSFIGKSEKTLLSSALVLSLSIALGAWAAAQQKKTPPAPPKPSAPHAAPAKPSTSHPSTQTHSTNSRPGTTQGKTGTGSARTTTGRPGTGTAGRNGTNSLGKTGSSGKGGNGNMAKTTGRTPPGRQVSLKGGGTASIRPNGQIRSINRNGMHIEHGLNGSRRIESTHNGARVVTTGRNSGYVQRPYVTRGGRTYVSRTVVINHVAYAHVYRSYSYGGYCCYYGYHPAFYYGPAYYGWAYNPWAAPVAYGWGWGGSPWYGYYGGYFAPYPVYPSAAFWLTDYLISANLQAAYQARAAANAATADNSGAANNGGTDQPQDNGNNDANQQASSGPVALSPEVKEAIAEEVKAQLAAQQAAAAKPDASGGAQSAAATEEVPPALDPARRTFVVASDLAVTGTDGQECQLTEGDVITRITDTPDGDRKVTASIAASKKSDCAKGKQVSVAVDDLQEMHNHFEEQLDNGMKELSSKQGTGGLPKAPDTSTVPSDVPPPAADASAAKALDDQQANADQVEAQVVKEAFSQGS
jgi:hypothetical protein